MLGAKMRASFISSYRTYGARRVWHDLLAEGLSCGLHRVERLMRQQALKARPRRRGLPKNDDERSVIAGNVLDRQFTADAPNKKWVADFTYIWTAMAAVRIDPTAVSECSSQPPLSKCCNDQLSPPNTPTSSFSG